MTEVGKESLSALIDGEATEIEVHRLVREFRSDEGLSTSWSAYQHIRSTVRAEKSALSRAHHHALFNRISEAIEAEETHSRPEKAPMSSGKVVMGSLALAASLVIAVFIGVQTPSDQAPAGLAASGNVSAPGATVPLAVQPVSTFQPTRQSDFLQNGMPQTGIADAAADSQTSELVELDEEKQRLLRNYLNQHDRMARMNDNRQFVNYRENTR